MWTEDLGVLDDGTNGQGGGGYNDGALADADTIQVEDSDPLRAESADQRRGHRMSDIQLQRICLPNLALESSLRSASIFAPSMRKCRILSSGAIAKGSSCHSSGPGSRPPHMIHAAHLKHPGS